MSNTHYGLNEAAVLPCMHRGGRRRNFGLGQIFEFLLGQKFVRGQIRCKFYVRILNAKQIQIFLKNDKVCIVMFANANF